MGKIVLLFLIHNFINSGVFILPVQLVFEPLFSIIVEKLVPFFSVALLTVKSIFLLLIPHHKLKIFIVLVSDFLDDVEEMLKREDYL